MSYATVGTIKSIDLSNHTFKLDPISRCRFEVKEGDEESSRIMFADESSKDPNELKLVSKGTDFKFKENLECAMIVLKQGKGRIKVVIEGEQLTAIMKVDDDASEDTRSSGSGSGGEPKSAADEKMVEKPVKIEVL